MTMTPVGVYKHSSAGLCWPLLASLLASGLAPRCCSGNVACTCTCTTLTLLYDTSACSVQSWYLLPYRNYSVSVVDAAFARFSFY